MKKSINLKRRIILAVSVAVVVIALAFAARIFFMSATIEGDWVLAVNPEISNATADEADTAKAYYTFSSSGQYGDGTYKTYYEGGIEEGEYKLSEKDDKKYINLGTEELEYTISKSKLTIIYPEYTDEYGQTTSAQEYIFERAKAPNYEKESYKDYKTDKSLLSEWTTSDRKLYYGEYELSYTETVMFKENGIMTIHYESADLMLDRYMYYAYTADSGKLTFSLVTDKETRYNAIYNIDKDGNLTFSDDSTTASIFADEFFSDVIYYPSSNYKEKSK